MLCYFMASQKEEESSANLFLKVIHFSIKQQLLFPFFF